MVFHQDLVLKIDNLRQLYQYKLLGGNKMKLHTAEELKAMSIEEATIYFDRLHKTQAKAQLQRK